MCSVSCYILISHFRVERSACVTVENVPEDTFPMLQPAWPGNQELVYRWFNIQSSTLLYNKQHTELLYPQRMCYRIRS